jgi:hypothetical protein
VAASVSATWVALTDQPHSGGRWRRKQEAEPGEEGKDAAEEALDGDAFA